MSANQHKKKRTYTISCSKVSSMVSILLSQEDHVKTHTSSWQKLSEIITNTLSIVSAMASALGFTNDLVSALDPKNIFRKICAWLWSPESISKINWELELKIPVWWPKMDVRELRCRVRNYGVYNTIVEQAKYFANAYLPLLLDLHGLYIIALWLSADYIFYLLLPDCSLDLHMLKAQLYVRLDLIYYV